MASEKGPGFWELLLDHENFVLLMESTPPIPLVHQRIQLTNYGSRQEIEDWCFARLELQTTILDFSNRLGERFMYKF